MRRDVCISAAITLLLVGCHRVHQGGYLAGVSGEARAGSKHAARLDLLGAELGASFPSGRGVTLTATAGSLATSAPKELAEARLDDELSTGFGRWSAFSTEARVYLYGDWRPTCTPSRDKPCEKPHWESLTFGAGVFARQDALTTTSYVREQGSLSGTGQPASNSIWDPEGELGVFATVGPPGQGLTGWLELLAGAGASRLQGPYGFVRVKVFAGGFRYRPR